MTFKEIKSNINPSKVNPPDKVEIDKLIKIKLDKTFEAIGLANKLNDRIWFSDFDDSGQKNVVHFQLTKGLGAVFIFGKCFNFVPIISGTEKLTYHKTDKSTTVHLFDSSDSIQIRSLFGKKKPLQLTLINQSEFSKSLDVFIRYGLIAIKQWFDNNPSIEDCIKTCLQQISLGENYLLHNPSQDYLISFLSAKLVDKSRMNYHLNKFLVNRNKPINKDVEMAIRKQLNKLVTKK